MKYTKEQGFNIIQNKLVEYYNDIIGKQTNGNTTKFMLYDRVIATVSFNDNKFEWYDNKPSYTFKPNIGTPNQIGNKIVTLEKRLNKWLIGTTKKNV